MTDASGNPARAGNWRAFCATVVLAGIAALAWCGCGVTQRRHFQGTYVCGLCGVKAIVDDSSGWGTRQHHGVTVADTAISRALNAHYKPRCRHEWYLLTFGSESGGFLRASEQADGGTPFRTLKMLVRDDTFARELAKMPNAREVWHTIMQAGGNAPERMDDLLGNWWWTGPGRKPFPQWWAHSENRVKELAAHAGSRHGPPVRHRL